MENLHGRTDLIGVLHGVLLSTPKRPTWLDQTGRPLPCGVFVKQLEVHRNPGHSRLRRVVVDVAVVVVLLVLVLVLVLLVLVLVLVSDAC